MNHIWFKLFVLLRIPISVYSLLGYAMAGQFGVALFLTLLLYLTVVSIQLARFRPGALRLAGALLVFEVLGAIPRRRRGACDTGES